MMAKPRKKQGNPDLRHQVTPPAPPTAAIETRLFELISPGTFANLKTIQDKERSLRSRVLTLPVMAAIVLSLVYRQVHYLTDVLRLLETEGLLWVGTLSVSRQALSQRLNTLPACVFARLFEQVMERLSKQPGKAVVPSDWSGVVQQFGAVWIADASTLEALRKHFGQLRQTSGLVLAGKMLMVVEAFTHRPVAAWYESNSHTNETHWWKALAERLPIGGLLITDMGFYGFEWFDALTDAGKETVNYFV